MFRPPAPSAPATQRRPNTKVSDARTKDNGSRTNAAAQRNILHKGCHSQTHVNISIILGLQVTHLQMHIHRQRPCSSTSHGDQLACQLRLCLHKVLERGEACAPLACATFTRPIERLPPAAVKAHGGAVLVHQCGQIFLGPFRADPPIGELQGVLHGKPYLYHTFQHPRTNADKFTQHDCICLKLTIEKQKTKGLGRSNKRSHWKRSQSRRSHVSTSLNKLHHTLPSDDLPTLTAPTRVSETLAKSNCAIVSTSNPLLVPDAAPAPAPDMANTMMAAHRTAGAHEKQRRSALRGRQHADATQQPSAIVNRRMPDKTRTRQPAPDHCGWATGENGRHVPATPPRGDMAPIWTPCAGHTTRSRPASPPTFCCTRPRPTPRSSDVAR